jgi:hypothetical protein
MREMFGALMQGEEGAEPIPSKRNDSHAEGVNFEQWPSSRVSNSTLMNSFSSCS